MAQKNSDDKFKGSLRKLRQDQANLDDQIGSIIKDSIMNKGNIISPQKLAHQEGKSKSYHEMKVDKNLQREKANYNKIKIEVCHNDSKNKDSTNDIENLRAILEYKT